MVFLKHAGSISHAQDFFEGVGKYGLRIFYSVFLQFKSHLGTRPGANITLLLRAL